MNDPAEVYSIIARDRMSAVHGKAVRFNPQKPAQCPNIVNIRLRLRP